MSKFTFTRLASLTNAPATINGIITEIESAFDTMVSRDGAAPNQITADLDLNSKRILNLPAPVGSTEPVTLAYFQSTVQSEDAQLAADQAAASASLALTYKNAAETAKTNAETAETNAELAETNAETAETNAETARDLAQAWAESATPPAGGITKSSKSWAGQAEIYAGNAATAETNAEAARDATRYSKGLFATTAAAMGLGVIGNGTITGGSGGANGTFDLAFTGGTGSGAAGRFLVAGGALTTIFITAPGSYTVAPSFDFSASAGLTGASATCVLGTNVDVGEYFSTPLSSADESFVLYRVDAGPVATEIKRYSTAALPIKVVDDVPGVNSGLNGGSAYDSKAKVFYPAKASGSWGSGISLAALSSALVTSTERVIDFRDGNFAGDVTVARGVVTNSGLATNLLYTDSPTYAYSTFAANVPITRPDYGIGFFRESKNYLANSNAIVTQTTPSLPTGTYTLWALIPDGSSLSSALGTATASGVGTVVSGTPQTIVVTVAGTIEITASGAGILAQLEPDDVTTRTGPSPFIQTGAAVPAVRPADLGTVSGGLLTALQGAAGSIVIETNKVLFKTGLVNTLLYIDAATQIYLSNDLTATYNRSPTLVSQENGGKKVYTAYTWTGNLYTNARIKTGLTWSGSTMGFAAGNRQPQTISAAFNAGNVPTTVKIGSTVASGSQVLNGWITRVTTGSVRKTNAELYNACTALTRTKTIHGFTARSSLPKMRAGIANMNAQLASHPMIFCLGDSNTAGSTTATSNNYTYAWPYVVAQTLQAAGINARTTNWWGKCPANIAIGTYRTDMVDSGTVANYGISLGGDVCNMSAGAKRQFTPGVNTDTYDVWYYGGYGTFYIRDGVGGTILQTVDSSGAAGLRKITATSTLAARTWEIEAVGTVHLAGGRAYDSSVPGVDICNCGRSAYSISNYVQGTNSPEDSIPYLLTHSLLQPIMCYVDLGVNDANLGNNMATAKTNLGTLHTAIETYASAAYMTFQPTNPDIGLGNVTTPYATQYKWIAMLKAHAASVNAPIIDNWASWGGTATGTFIADPWVAAGSTTDAVRLGPFSDALLHLGVEGHQAIAEYAAELITESL